MMDVREVERRLTEHEDEHGDSGWDIIDEALYGDDDLVIAGLGTVRLIESVGGVGDGEHMHMVLRVVFEPEDDNLPRFRRTRYFQINGYYQSYDGGEWDGELFEVGPTRKTVTVYEAM